jgi:uncharacterized membrane protein YcaP (DUF421 family)
MDWDAVFGLNVSPWELIVRGTLMYWFLFIAFRIAMRRRTGSIALADILLLVLIADAAQNAMAGEYRSFPEGAVLVATLIGWNIAVDWASYKFEPFRKLAEPAPLPVVWRGRIMHKNLKYELVTVDELKAKLREKGIDDLSLVKAAYIESDGEFSVLTKNAKQSGEVDESTRKTGKAR